MIFALGVVTLRNLFHCALCLAAALIGTAALYVVLQAEYLAAIQILLYVGAVVTLVIFAIMLTEHLCGKNRPPDQFAKPAGDRWALLVCGAHRRLDPENTLARHPDRR